MANTQTQAEIQTSENTLPAAIAGAAGRTRRAALWALAKKGRLFWTLQTVGWTGFFLMHLLSAVGYGKEWGYGVYSLASAVIGFVFTSLAMRPVFRAIWKKPPFVVLSVALATTALCALGVTISKAHAYRLLIEPAWAPASWLGYMTDVQFNLYIILSWAGFYFVINYYMMLRDQKEQALQSARLADQAQLKMLRYQLNPHFLFNTLNAVSTLVLDKQTEPANAMLTRLSAFLRYSLDSDPLQKTTFAEELRALELYLHIEKARFQDRLKLEIDVDPKARRAMAPSLLLQPAVENAIKYSIAKRTEGGALRLKAHVREGRLFLAVCDDGPGLPGDPMKTLRDCAGVGFANMRDRLIHLYGEDHSFVIRNLAPKGFAVEIDIPFEEDA